MSDHSPSAEERVVALEALVLELVKCVTSGYRIQDCCKICFLAPSHADWCPIPAAAAVVGYEGTPAKFIK